MPTFRYQAVDARGNAVSGELKAAGPAEALRELEARGLKAERGGVEEVLEPASGRGRFSEEEATELGSQLAELAKAGVPLAPGLRAMAQEVPRRRVARALRELARHLEAGMSLEAGLESMGKRLPGHVQGLIAAGVQSGRLVEALEEMVAAENARIELRRRIWMGAAYPCFLLAAVVVLFIGFCAFFVPQFKLIYEEFEVELPAATRVLISLSGPAGLVIVGLLAALVGAFGVAVLARGRVWWRKVLYTVPLVGPIARWTGLLNFSRLMALLLGQRIPLPKALRMAGAGLREADLSAACRGAAREVEAGRSLTESLSQFWQFPPSLRPLVSWAEGASDPAAAFRAGAEVFEGRVQMSIALLETILPPVAFVFILAAVGFLISGLMLPLISLIQSLT